MSRRSEITYYDVQYVTYLCIHINIYLLINAYTLYTQLAIYQYHEKPVMYARLSLDVFILTWCLFTLSSHLEDPINDKEKTANGLPSVITDSLLHARGNELRYMQARRNIYVEKKWRN